MQLTIGRAALARELALLAGVAAKNTTIPILSSVRIEAGDGLLRLTCTDLECGITSGVPCEVKGPGSICIPAKRLLGFVQTLTGESVTIKTDDKAYATVTCGKARARIPGTSAESFPELPTAPEPTLTLDARKLARQFARVSFAITIEESRNALKGLLAAIAGGVLTCVATDGHRLAHATSDAATGTNARLLVPVLAVPLFAKLADASEGGASVAVSHDDSHLFFTIGKRSIVARKIVGNFPDYERILPKEYAPNVTIESGALKAAMESVRQFGEIHGKGGVSRKVKFSITPGELSVSAATFDVGECENSAPCEYSGPGVAVGFSPDYIADFIGAAGTEKVEICIRDGRTAAEMRPAGDASYRYVVMPMRID